MALKEIRTGKENLNTKFNKEQTSLLPNLGLSTNPQIGFMHVFL